MLAKSSTYDDNRSFIASEQNFNINFVKAKTKFCKSLRCIGDNSLLMEKKSVSLKSIM